LPIGNLFVYLPKIQNISALKNHITEADLVSRLKAKDRLALEYLYDHYSGALYGVVFRVIPREDIAEEVLQDVFLKAWDKIEQYDSSKGKLFTWLLNIARNQAIDKTRSKEINKELKTGGIEKLVNKVDRQKYEEQDTEAIGVREILKKLPEEQQFVMEHLYFKGYTQSELAEEFDIPLGTIKTRTRMALQQLRITLGES
jgi:RNA polymerase sigma factor (sigma-70 family)